MKLTVLPSGHGDCLLLESGKRRMLIDGGVSKAFREEVLPVLAKTKNRPIDCLYVSHIDNDHLGGLVVLVDTLYAWRVYHYRKGKKPAPKQPKLPEPPPLLKIWHNVFSDVLEDNADPVAAALAQTALMMSGANDEELVEASKKIKGYHDNLAEGAKEAIRISYRVGADQLGLKVNPEYKKKLMIFNPKKTQPKLSLGKATFTLIGPRQPDLEKLRLEWNKWLEEHKKIVHDLRRRGTADAEDLTSAAAFIEPLEMEASNLVSRLTTPDLAAKADQLGLRSEVTTPNLASLMFLVEEGKKSILLTGDGHADDILSGLEDRKKLKKGGSLHVNVLKVPHHGAEFNTSIAFAERVTADHYVFCGNGFQGNPEKVVLETIVNARKKVGGGKYTFWFNTSATHNDHMRMIASTARKLAKANKNLTVKFVKEPFEVPLT